MHKHTHNTGYEISQIPQFNGDHDDKRLKKTEKKLRGAGGQQMAAEREGKGVWSDGTIFGCTDVAL